MAMVNVISIDAWRDGEGGWTWNQWFKKGQIDDSVCDLPTRKLLAKLREEGFLDSCTAGKVFVEDDQYNKVVCWRSDRQPMIAVAYGEAQEF